MRSAYGVAFDRLFTRVDPELAHRLGFGAVRAGRPLARAALGRRTPSVPVSALGLRFAHPLGLAAGFDKNAVGIDALAALGFGHVEVGTVTARPQPGNPRPRLFRLPADRAIVNRMGFNNDGAEVVARRLAVRQRRLNGAEAQLNGAGAQLDGAGAQLNVVVGVNIGKSKVVPDDDQAAVLDDYRTSTGLLAPHADYLVVNVSSPNTPGLRNLQAVDRLEPLLRAVRARADEVTDRRVPLLVKIAPDLADDDLRDVGALALALGLDGVVATNTTIARDGLASPAAEVEDAGAGGLSGRPLRDRALKVLSLLRAEVGPDLCLVGVGGITTPDDAVERLAAGADLLQAYTGFVYGGPGWPRDIVRGIARAAEGAPDSDPGTAS